MEEREEREEREEMEEREEYESIRKQETWRLLEWIKNNRDKWQNIVFAIAEQDARIGAEYKEAICDLRENGFYQLIVMLVYSRSHVVDRAVEAYVIGNILQEWDFRSVEKITDEILEGIH